MSRPSKSAMLEQEQSVKTKIATEIAVQEQSVLEKVRAERERLEAIESERQYKEAISCWCGINHNSGNKITDLRLHDKPALRPLGTGYPAVFIGGLPYELVDGAIKDLIRNLLGPGISDRFLDGLRIPRWDDGQGRGIAFLACRSIEQAAGVITCINGHQVCGFKKKMTLAANYGRAKSGER